MKHASRKLIGPVISKPVEMSVFDMFRFQPDLAATFHSVFMGTASLSDNFGVLRQAQSPLCLSIGFPGAARGKLWHAPVK
jgi:hypothetical protein